MTELDKYLATRHDNLSRDVQKDLFRELIAALDNAYLVALAELQTVQGAATQWRFLSICRRSMLSAVAAIAERQPDNSVAITRRAIEAALKQEEATIVTVRELMDELQEQDPDARVLTVCPDADTAYERAIDRVVSGDDEDAVLSRCGMYRRYFEEDDGKSVYLRSSQVWAKREWSARY